MNIYKHRAICGCQLKCRQKVSKNTDIQVNISGTFSQRLRQYLAVFNNIVVMFVHCANVYFHLCHLWNIIPFRYSSDTQFHLPTIKCIITGMLADSLCERQYFNTSLQLDYALNITDQKQKYTYMYLNLRFTITTLTSWFLR